MKIHLCALTAFFSLGVILQAVILPAEKLLPNDTLLFISIPDTTKFREIVKTSPQSQLLADPSMKAFKENFMKKFSTDIVAPFEKEMGIKFSDYSGLAKGQLAFALTQNGWEGKTNQSLGLILLMDTKEKSGQLTTNLASLRKKWVESGKEIKSEKIRGIDFTTLITTDEEIGKTWDKIFPSKPDADEPAKKDPKKMEITVGQFESLLLVGNSTAALEKILARQAGGMAQSLAELPVYEANHNAHFRDPNVFAWVNLKPILEMMTKKSAENPEPETNNPLQINPDQMIGALGLNGLKSLAFTYNLLPEGSMIKFFANAPESGRQGILKMLVAETKDAKPPVFVPSDTVKFSRWRLDLPKAWKALESMLEEISPASTGVLKLIFDSAGKDQDPNFDLRKELIGNMGDDFITIQKNPRASTIAELQKPPTLYLIGSPDAERLAKALKVAMSSLGQPSSAFKDREFLGRKIYSLAAPTFGQPAPGSAPPRSLNFSGSGGYLAISTDVSALEEYLRSNETKGKSLGDIPGLADIAQKVGGMGTGLFGIQNPAEEMRTTFDTLKKDEGGIALLVGDSPLGAALGLNDNKKLKEWADFSLLPPYESVAKYFYYSIYAGSFGADGFTMKVFSPTPPDLKK